jgi:hypothetical protein
VGAVGDSADWEHVWSPMAMEVVEVVREVASQCRTKKIVDSNYSCVKVWADMVTTTRGRRLRSGRPALNPVDASRNGKVNPSSQL